MPAPNPIPRERSRTSWRPTTSGQSRPRHQLSMRAFASPQMIAERGADFLPRECELVHRRPNLDDCLLDPRLNDQYFSARPRAAIGESVGTIAQLVWS